MNWKSRFGKKVTFGLASVLALAASSSSDAVAQKKSAEPSPAKMTPSKKNTATQRVVFAKYNMLDTAATKAAYLKYLKQTKTEKARLNLLSGLSEKKINQTKIEKAIAPLVIGLSEDEVHLTLDVIMRDYYLSSLEKKKLSIGQVESRMESRAKALDEAVFGKGAPAEEGNTRSSAKAVSTSTPKAKRLFRVRLRHRR